MSEQTVETKSCRNCGVEYPITFADLEYLDKVALNFAGNKFSIPVPTHCPECRHMRRFVWRNERILYKRSCDLCGKSLISHFDKDVEFPVYCQDCWRSDKWDPMDYARDYDLDRDFFSQIKDMLNIFPQIALINNQAENSLYCNFADKNKNCYMLINSNNNEDCFHSILILGDKDCSDCYLTLDSQYCYECLDCNKCYQLFFSQECQDCSKSMFLYECKNCNDCIACVNLNNAQYKVFNKQLSKEEYLEVKSKLNNYSSIEEMRNKFENFLKTQIFSANHHINSENVTGDHLTGCKNSFNCFNGFYSENCSHMRDFIHCNYCMDGASLENCEMSYENTSLIGYHNMFTAYCRDSSNLYYTFSSHNSKELFGCMGLRNKEYCILNKQYAKDDYEKLMNLILTKMIQDGEFGEFFPVSIAPFAYNETVANEYYPLDESKAKNIGMKWKQLPEIAKSDNAIDANDLPGTIELVSDDILNKVIICSKSKRLYRLQKVELDFYRKLKLPLSRIHPEQRHLDRMARRTPNNLFDNNCKKCDIEIKTSYAPEREELVYCERCYNEEIY